MSSRWLPPTTERNARVELAAAYRMAFELGWTDLGATHFSCRLPEEPDAYLMLQAGHFFDEVTATNLVKVGLDGEIRDGRPGAEVNPAGVTIHGGILQERPDLMAVLHTHTAAGIAASCHPDGLLPLSQHAMRFFEHQGFHVYEGVALDDDEGPRLVKDLGDNELLLLRNHGLLAVGDSLPAAFSALYYGEFSATVQVATLSSVHAPIVPDDAVCRHSFEQYSHTGYQFRDWLGTLRHITKHHPDFSD